MIPKNKNVQGFTLTEMAIVVVVIAIVVTGIVSGAAIREEGKRQAVVNEMNQYISGIKMFRSKYSYRPGDHPATSNYFSGDAATNGDGDGSWDTAAERDVAWPQLYAAGFITQNIGKAPTTSTTKTIGLYRPESNYEGTGWTILNSMDSDPEGGVTVRSYHILRISGMDDTDSNGGEDLSEPMLSIADHIYIDTKVDISDTPASGNYVVGEDATCITGTGTYTYSTTQTLLCTGNYVEKSVTL